MTFTFIDLFAGVGGFHHALGQLGGECVFAVEFDRDCRAVYEAAFPALRGDRFASDIRNLTQRDGMDVPEAELAARIPDHDVLCAGFPCQPFSKSGQQLGIHDRTRGTLFHDIMQIVKAKQPKAVLLENVPNLVGPRHASTWAMIIASLREAGYGVSATPVLVSPHRLAPPYGSPQVRERVFILGIRGRGHAQVDQPPLITREDFADWQPSNWRLADYLSGTAPERFRLRPNELTWLTAWDAFVRGIESDVLPGFPLWVDFWRLEFDVPSSAPEWKVDFIRKNHAFYLANRDFLDEWMDTEWDQAGSTVRSFPLSRRKFEWQARDAHPGRSGRTLWDLLVQLRPSGIRVKAPTYVPALVAITQTSVVAEQRRRLTPWEAATLQQIPYEPFLAADLDDEAIYRQLGNAVHVGVVKYVAQALLRASQIEHGQRRPLLRRAASA